MERAWTILVLALTLTAAAVPAGARERVVHLKMGPFRIEARRDREVCQAVRIPHARGLDVVTYETRSRTARDVGTHHFIAYGYQGGDSAGFPRTLVDDPGCNGFGPADFFRNRVFLAGSGGEYVHGRWAITSGGVPPVDAAAPDPGRRPGRRGRRAQLALLQQQPEGCARPREAHPPARARGREQAGAAHAPRGDR